MEGKSLTINVQLVDAQPVCSVIRAAHELANSVLDAAQALDVIAEWREERAERAKQREADAAGESSNAEEAPDA